MAIFIFAFVWFSELRLILKGHCVALVEVEEFVLVKFTFEGDLVSINGLQLWIFIISI